MVSIRLKYKVFKTYEKTNERSRNVMFNKYKRGRAVAVEHSDLRSRFGLQRVHICDLPGRAVGDRTSPKRSERTRHITTPVFNTYSLCWSHHVGCLVEWRLPFSWPQVITETRDDSNTKVYTKGHATLSGRRQ